MKKSDIPIFTDSLDLTENDITLINIVISGFKPVIKNNRCFYTTVFLNDQNRRIEFYVSYGKLNRVVIEKIDSEGE